MKNRWDDTAFVLENSYTSNHHILSSVFHHQLNPFSFETSQRESPVQYQSYTSHTYRLYRQMPPYSQELLHATIFLTPHSTAYSHDSSCSQTVNSTVEPLIVQKVPLITESLSLVTTRGCWFSRKVLACGPPLWLTEDGSANF
ncbi:hypothetical protein HBI56_084930 [Parastagonospora nodorum]|nr:hypothetical protein HBI10_117660 [Parastagonospora nodorum]KAH4025264.1 hypothetical protein HBI13_079530 [Parastagonospora nodorum]KAH4122589.1 hypothetical protein HBH47_080210 [Parastagonospora nodorum]KAH4171041.1 hypothetical protein HBH43_106740 [Parastagonospora nodorum]KAH4206127.1 hypothetical protein HBI95_124450 [Parastagonospora nodorum]